MPLYHRGQPLLCFPDMYSPFLWQWPSGFPVGIHLSLTLTLCDSRELDLPSGLLGKHFTATSPGRNWNHSNSPSSLISSILYFLLHSSQPLQICILHPYIHRAECSAPASQLPSSVVTVSFSYKHLQLGPRSAALWLLLSKCVQLCFVLSWTRL